MELAPYELKVVRRGNGWNGILYRQELTDNGRKKQEQVASITPLAYEAGELLINTAMRVLSGKADVRNSGNYPLNYEWGNKLRCYAITTKGLRNLPRMGKAAWAIQGIDEIDAAWWLGIMGYGEHPRGIKAFRVLTEAIE
jgi:hypothetical protein